MNLFRWMAPGLALACTAASAVTLNVTPANPTPADTLVLEVGDTAPCASIVPNSLTMSDGRVITVQYNDGANILCIAPVPQPLKVTLGRFPAGTYGVRLVPSIALDQTAGTTTVRVANSSSLPGEPPSDNYTGAWAVQGQTDGVFVEQYGKAAFVSWLHHGTDGKTSWAVMPEAKWEAGADGIYRFRGGLLKTDVLPTGTGTGSGTVTSFYYIGMGSFIPSSLFDEASFKVELAGESVAKDFRLQRLRF
jgi:hypothetical protein